MAKAGSTMARVVSLVESAKGVCEALQYKEASCYILVEQWNN